MQRFRAMENAIIYPDRLGTNENRKLTKEGTTVVQAALCVGRAGTVAATMSSRAKTVAWCGNPTYRSGGHSLMENHNFE